ncbi:hypothetical protein GW764_03695 [Candidatus Parcubacteria bacterium]|nr:hypothetical protein [Candidatus Parcubacteria bacterium]
MEEDKDFKEKEIEQMQNTPNTKPKEEGTVGPLIGSIIVIILIILGGIYYFNNVDLVSKNSSNIDEELLEIEAEINKTNLDDIDTELDQIQREIEAELD